MCVWLFNCCENFVDGVLLKVLIRYELEFLSERKYYFFLVFFCIFEGSDWIISEKIRIMELFLVYVVLESFIYGVRVFLLYFFCKSYFVEWL